MSHWKPLAIPLLAVTLSLTACSGVEPEKRAYPLIMAVDHTQGDFEVIYGMPDMAAVTGQDKGGGSSDGEGGSGNPMVLSFSGQNAEEIQQRYDSTQEKYLDLGHLQVLVFGDSLLSGDHWQQVIDDFRQNPALGEDIYLFRTRDIGAVMDLNGTLSTSLGEYLVGIFENRPSSRARETASLRDAYDSLLGSGEFPKLPVLIPEDGGIRVVFPSD